MTTAALDASSPLYRDPSRPIEERVDDLLDRMTVEEMAAQLGSAWVFQLAHGPHGAAARPGTATSPAAARPDGLGRYGPHG